MTTTNTQGCTYLDPSYNARTHDYTISPTPYCGCRVLENKLYCEEHYPIVYQAGTAQRRRHKDIRVAARVQDIGSLFNDVVAELESEGEIDL